MSDEIEIQKVISRINAAWREKAFVGLDECFHEDVVIVGPGYVEIARGRDKCAESYREFATNAAVLSYSESAHSLRSWESTAVYTYAWEMTYQREKGPNRDSGTDQLVFQLGSSGWQLIWRYMFFVPSN
jgi:uncharacterized protein (TIGR02246 family)